jgi:serine phosphatase RsbU (regulator of sigma subunit)
MSTEETSVASADDQLITTTASFETRLQRGELRAAYLMLALWAFLLVMAIFRRLLGNDLMPGGGYFLASLGVLSVAIVHELAVIRRTRRHLATGTSIATWHRVANLIVETAVPALAITILYARSPRGEHASLSAPAILIFPIVILLSITRLRPRTPLIMGCTAAAIHMTLVSHSILSGDAPRSQWPILLTYEAILAATGFAASWVARQARDNVIEAVREATSAEREARARKEMERDLDIARDIQASLMPSTAPSIAAFDVAGMARPAQQTGGDYYDWQPTADGRLIVAIADVTGHGIGPALVMAVCRAYARASASHARDAASLLAHVNGLIVEDLGSTGRFITMVIAILSPDGAVELASAGHGPSFLHQRASGTIDLFGGDGLPLGIDASETFTPSRHFQMQPGDTLVLATDGFIEWARAGDREQFGSERLRDTIERLPSQSSAECIRQIDATVQAFAQGEPQQDDTSVVVIRRR